MKDRDHDKREVSDKDVPRLSRRSAMAAGAAGAVTALLGLPVRKSRAQTTSYDPILTEDIPEGTSCEVCGMKVKNFEQGNAQLVTASEDRRYFCSPACLTAYYVYPTSEKFNNSAQSHETVEAAWVHDYTDGDYIDAFDSYFVLDNNSNNLDPSVIPMGENPVPFGNQQDAQDYVSGNDLKNSNVSAIDQDIIQGLDKFDFELAKVFSSYLPDSLPQSSNPFMDENGAPESRTNVISRIVEWNTNNGVINGTQYSRSDIISYIVEWNTAK
ncbi:nitrous oxide reductase accessory protein NosL [Halorutilales archaeon Cl-col2-1]